MKKLMHFKASQGSVLLITLVILTIIYMSFFSLVFLQSQLVSQSELLLDQLEVEAIINIVKSDLKNIEMKPNQCLEIDYKFAATDNCLIKVYEENNVSLITSTIQLTDDKNYRVSFYLLND